MKTKGTRLRIVRSNKRERTVTIEKTYPDGSATKYKSTPLNKEDFQYYTNYATENDIQQYLNYGDYYKL